MKFYFFDISKDVISEGKKFSFSIFLLDPDENIRTTFLQPHTEISSEHLTQNIFEEKFSFQIHYRSIKYYLQETKKDFEHIKELNQEKFDFMTLLQSRKQLTQSNPLLTMLNQCLDSTIPNYHFFKKIRLATLKELSQYSIEDSNFTNVVICLCEKVFTRDFKQVQIASIAFQLAKECHLTHPYLLSKIIFAALFKDIGSMFQPNQSLKSEPENLTRPEVTAKNKEILNIFCPDISNEITEITHYMQSFPNSSSPEDTKLTEVIIAAELLATAVASKELGDIKIEEVFDNKYASLFQNFEQIKNAANSIINLLKNFF